MLELVDRDVFAVTHSLEHLGVGDVLAVADVGGLFLSVLSILNTQSIQIFLLQDKAFNVGHLAVDLGDEDAGDVGLVVFMENLLYPTLADFTAVVVDQEDLGAVLHLVFDGEEAPVLGEVVAEDGETGAMVDAGHAADALVVVDSGSRRSGRLADGALWAGEGAGIAGETVEAVELYEGLGGHALGGGQVGTLEQAHGVLLGVDILARDVEVVVVVVADAEVLGDFVGSLLAAEDGAGALANTNSVADAIDTMAVEFATLGKELVVGGETGADVDDVDIGDDLLGARYGLEILALGDDGTYDARMVVVGDGTDEGVARHDGDAEATHTVGLDGESALAGHGLDDGADGGARLHALVGGEVADVAGTDGEDALAEEGVFLVHHLLEDGGSVDAGEVVVLEGRHEGHGARCHDEKLGVDVAHLTVDEVLHGNARSLEDIPHGGVQQDAVLTVTRKGLGYVEATHAAIFLFLLEEEELVGLHIELAADTRIAVDDEVVDAKSIQLLAAGKTGRTRADNGDLGLVDLHSLSRLLRTFWRFESNTRKVGFVGDSTHLADTVNSSDTDAAHATVDQHLAGAALADAALKGAVAALQRVAVDGESRLVEGLGDSVTFAPLDGLAFKKEFDDVGLRDVQNRVFFDFVHSCMCLRINLL